MTKMARRKVRPKRPDLATVYSKLAGESKRARLMSEVEPFIAVPTIFTGFNRLMGVGGAPLSCVWLVHGPSMGGKTAALLALLKSVQQAGGLTAFVDAELAADTRRWFPRLGVDTSKCLYIGRSDDKKALGPLSYEEVVDEVDGLIERYLGMIRAGEIDPNTPFIIVVDSISRMVPGQLFKNLKKDGGKALAGGVGRLQALLNTAWMAELGAKVGDANILFAAIAHEYTKTDGKSWTSGYKVRGGDSLIYDSMIEIRVTYAGGVADYSKDGSPTVGKKHRIKLLKNKHGPAFKECYFYTSDGSGKCPMGFDRTREVIHEGLLRGIIEGPKVDDLKLTIGSSLVFDSAKYTLGKLYEHPDIIDRIAETLDSQLVEDEEELSDAS